MNIAAATRVLATLVTLILASARAHAQDATAPPTPPPDGAQPPTPPAPPPTPPADPAESRRPDMPGEPPSTTRAPRSATNDNWFLDGGIIPFGYVATGVALGTLLATPPDKPILFSASEGGAPMKSETIPSWAVTVYNAGIGAAVAAFDRPARWYHFKGMLEAVATTLAVNQLAKITFGRHRPYYDPATSTNKDDRMSFFSEHSSMMAVSSVYMGIYLHEHVFAPWRGDQALAVWELPVYAGLAGLAIYVPYTRVADNKHHLSDVIVGGAVGSAAAIAFYIYQEGRFRRAHKAETGPRVTVLPWTSGPGATLTLGF